jgi:carboxyl-terminal processing protease
MKLANSILGAALTLPLFAAGALADDVDYVADVEFALAEIEKQSGHFFKLKDIDWKKVSREFKKDAKKVKTDQEHLVLLWRLVARVKDGHAAVEPLEAGKGVKWPEQPAKTGPGMFWCRIGKKIYVKTTWSSARDVGIEPGMEVVKVDGVAVGKWLDARVEELSDLIGFSTPDQAFFYACHWGLADEVGTRMKLDLVDVKGKRRKRTLTYTKASATAWGPAVFPEGLEGTKDLNYGHTAGGWGYIQVRRCKGDVPTQMDVALAGVADAPGLILDFRGNSGGGFDHDEFMGRFVPKGERIAFNKGYASKGEQPYGGPIVVIIDATVRSTGETASGIFKEDGRAYVIGESNTAGMSSSKTMIELPSGLFALKVSIASNKGRFNKGRGIEGIGVVPHELVAFRAEDLAEGIDTLIARAEALLADYPQDDVPYDPADFGPKK